MSKDKGWVKTERALLDAAIWNNNEPFDERSAYIDILLRANYEEKTFRPKGSTEVVVIKPGELFTSIGMLAERWRWSENKVRRYLKMLKNVGLANFKRHSRGTLVSLENIDVEGDGRHPRGTPNGTPSGRPSGTPDGTPRGTRLKKDKNSKEYKESKKRAQRGLNLWGEDPE